MPLPEVKPKVLNSSSLMLNLVSEQGWHLWMRHLVEGLKNFLAGGYGYSFDKVHTSWASELVDFTRVTQRPASHETKQAIYCI